MATSSLVRTRGPRLAELGGHRFLSVVSWGRNLEGQCGHADNPVVAEPTEIEALAGLGVRNVQGGRAHAAAVLDTGEVLTWGCGHSGKLGHGAAGSSPNPTRIEALVGRANVRCASLGAHHSLFLDQSGAVWSCGENKEGQCGLGTPLETLAAQRRAEWDMGPVATPSHASQTSMGMRGTNEGWAAEGGGAESGAQSSGWAWPQQQQQQEQQSQLQQHANRMAPYLQPYAEHTARQAELEHTRRLIADSQEQARRHAVEASATRPGFGPSGQYASSNVTPANFAVGGLSPGQLATPTRIGQDLQPFLTGAAHQIPAGMDGPIISVAASRYFSAQVTADGRVWTFGGGFNGELGAGGSSWASAAQAVDGPVGEALRREGGASHVAAGTTFCVCLTASGKVVVWGQLPGHRQPGQARAPVHTLSDLPPITHLVCGSSHAIMSDGERVWAIGRWLSADGAKPMGGSGLQPQQVLDLRGEGVSQLAAGAHSSAAISGDGRLMLWGKLLAHEHATSLANTYGSPECEAAVGKWAFSEGMGADEPVHVPGLHNVKGVALGATHATVLLA